MRKRTKQIIVRLNDSEHAMLRAKMNLSGLSYSALFRKFIRDVNVSVFPADDMKTLVGHVSKIGGNINQIARVANSTQGADATMLTNACHQVDRIWRLLKELETWR